MLGIIGLFFFSACASPQDFYAAQKNAQGNEYAFEQYYADAKKAYVTASEISSVLSPLTKNNHALVLARQRQFEEANTLTEDILCDQEQWCAEILYNKGNILYRFGEEKKERAQIDLWKKALATYEKSAEKNPNDQWTQENIEFLKKKLQTAEKKQEEKEKKEKKEGKKEDQKDQGQKGDEKKHGSSKDKKEEEQKKEEGKKEKESDSKKGEKGEEGEGKSEEKKNISEQLDDQIEKYMDDMEQTEKQAQEYFQRNPSTQQQGDPNDPFSQMYNDPFFQELFQIPPSQKKGGNQRKQNEIDW